LHNKQFRITLTNKKLACQHLGPAPSALERAGGEVKAGTQYRMQNENLKREIDARSLSFAFVNITLGSGIFVIPAIIAEGLGATAILAYFF